MNILEKLWSKVKEIRKSKKISQVELSKASWLDRSYLSNIERAEVNCSLINLEKLANWLWVDIKDLF
jgi:transcriptional regulator with XRE-family HTH domain